MRLRIYAIAVLASVSVSAACWAKEQSFSKRSARVWVGCEDTRGTQIEYHAPPGWKIIRYGTGWAGLYGVEGHTANIQTNSPERPTSVLATGTITGRTKGTGVQILGHRFARCPGGGRGWLQVAGIIAPNRALRPMASTAWRAHRSHQQQGAIGLIPSEEVR
jgi:hypothetical protein